LDNRTLKEFKQFIKDDFWITKNYSKLLSIYENRYIAVRNEKVLDNDPNQLQLINRLQKIYGKDKISNIQIDLIH
jgi:hypothetical protein